MKNTGREIAEILLQINAIQLKPQKPFTWASGLRSPIYCDNRLLLSYPDFRTKVVTAMVEKAAAFGPFDCVAGVATAGIAHGALLANALDKPFAYVRSKAKAHGKTNQIEGNVKQGQRVLIVEDLISTGGSALRAATAVDDHGGDSCGVIAIFTYGLPVSVKAFKDAQMSLSTLTDYETMLDAALAGNYIREDDLNALKAWKEDPELWSNTHTSI